MSKKQPEELEENMSYFVYPETDPLDGSVELPANLNDLCILIDDWETNHELTEHNSAVFETVLALMATPLVSLQEKFQTLLTAIIEEEIQNADAVEEDEEDDEVNEMVNKVKDVTPKFVGVNNNVAEDDISDEEFLAELAADKEKDKPTVIMLPNGRDALQDMPTQEEPRFCPC